MPARLKCPACGDTGQVEKVSTLYLVGIGLNRQPQPGKAPLDLLPVNPWVSALPPAELAALARRLKPPSSGKQGFSRPLHPDMIVVVFSLVLPIFLYGMWTSQRPVLPVVIAILVCAYALYFWQRKAILARFQRNQASRQSAEERARRGVERWMSLYYCHRDDGVFPAHSGQLIPTDQMPGYLFRPES